MNLHAMITGDAIKPAGEFQDGGRTVKYDEKRILTLLELNAVPSDGVKHLMELTIRVDDPVAGKDSSIVGLIGDFVITEIKPTKREQEIGIVGRVVKLTSTISEKPIANKAA